LKELDGALKEPDGLGPRFTVRCSCIAPTAPWAAPPAPVYINLLLYQSRPVSRSSCITLVLYDEEEKPLPSHALITSTRRERAVRVRTSRATGTLTDTAVTVDVPRRIRLGRNGPAMHRIGSTAGQKRPVLQDTALSRARRNPSQPNEVTILLSNKPPGAGRRVGHP
jgi:hypothetical protein